MTGDQVAALADVTMTGDQVAALADAGRFWWWRDGQFFATDSRDPQTDGDVYLLDGSPEWLAQWQGDWQGLADFLTPMLARLPD